MVELYIKELLFTSDCVILPGFGGFVCNYEGAEISLSKNKISPPHKKIAFNEKLISNDGKLASIIANSNNISISQSENLINNFITNILKSLSEKSFFEIEDLGKFSYLKENNIVFEQFSKVNYLEDSFGLPDLYFAPLDRTQNNSIFNPKIQKPMAENINDQENENELENSLENEELEEVDVDEFVSANKKEKKQSLGIYYIMSIVALLFVTATTYYLNMDKKTYAIGSFSPLSWFGSDGADENKENKLLPEEAPSETESTIEETPSFEENNNTIENAESTSSNNQLTDAITSETGRFYVIVGSFRRTSKAINLRNSLNSSGLSPKIIKQGGTASMLRVSAMDFDSYEAASQKKAELIETYGSDLWILTY
jgi:hypothetical protein